MTLAEINELESMVGGAHVLPPLYVDRQQERVVDLGVVLMSKSEYETLKTMVFDARCDILPPIIANFAQCPVL